MRENILLFSSRETMGTIHANTKENTFEGRESCRGSFNSKCSPGAPRGIIATHDAMPWIDRLKLPQHFVPEGQIKLIFSSQTTFVLWYPRRNLLDLKFFPVGVLSVVSIRQGV